MAPFHHAVLVTALTTLTVAIAPPAATAQAQEPPCAAEEYARAQRATEAAQNALSTHLLDPNMPNEVANLPQLRAAQAAEEQAVAAAQRDLEEARRAVQEHATRAREKLDQFKARHPSVLPIPAAEYSAQRMRIDREKETVQAKIADAERAKQRFDADQTILETRAALDAERVVLNAVLGAYMKPGTRPGATLLSQLNDASYRQHDPAQANKPDDVRAEAEKLLQFDLFVNPEVQAKRVAIRTQLNDGPPWDALRELGPELIAEIDNARRAVSEANRKVTDLEDQIAARMREMDAAGAEGVAALAALSGQLRSLQRELDALNLRNERAVLEQNLARLAEDPESDGNVKWRRTRLAEAEARAARAAEKVRDVETWAGRRVALTNALAEAEQREAAAKAAEVTARDAALAQARREYDAVEADLRQFKQHVADDRRDIQRQATTDRDPDGARRRLNALRMAVQQKREQAVAKIEAIRSALQAGRDCYRDIDLSPVDQYVINTLEAKLAALRGGGAALVSDIEGPGGLGDALLDLPVDNADAVAATAPTTTEAALGPLWVCEKPVIEHGSNMTIDESSASWTVEIEGKTGTGKITWEGVKSEYREGEDVTLTMQASATLPGIAIGSFKTDCAGKDPKTWVPDAFTGRNKEDKENPDAKLEFKFAPRKSDSGYIRVQASQFDTGGATAGSVTWIYKKKQP